MASTHVRNTMMYLISKRPAETEEDLLIAHQWVKILEAELRRRSDAGLLDLSKLEERTLERNRLYGQSRIRGTVWAKKAMKVVEAWERDELDM